MFNSENKLITTTTTKFVKGNISGAPLIRKFEDLEGEIDAMMKDFKTLG